jgi:Bacterial Ig domain/FG-GAP repeat
MRVFSTFIAAVVLCATISLISAQASTYHQSYNAKLVAPAALNIVDDYFARSCSINSDGTVVALGCPECDVNGGNNGLVVVYTRPSASNNNTAWDEGVALPKQSITGTSDKLGGEISLSGDGTRIIVGAEPLDGGAGADSGGVFIYHKSGGTWAETFAFTATEYQEGLGSSVAMSTNGLVAAAGAMDKDMISVSNAGAVYVMVYSGSQWSQVAELTSTSPDVNGDFGRSIGLSSDGSYIVVGAPFEENLAARTEAADEGAAYMFERQGSTNSWTATHRFTAFSAFVGDRLGHSIAVNGDGTVVAAGAPYPAASMLEEDAGYVYIFARSSNANSNWHQAAVVHAPLPDGNGFFGYSLSLDSSGHKLLVGQYNEPATGSAFLFVSDASSDPARHHWRIATDPYAPLDNSNAQFGFDVEIASNGQSMVIADNYDTSNEGAGFTFDAPWGPVSNHYVMYVYEGQNSVQLNVVNDALHVEGLSSFTVVQAGQFVVPSLGGVTFSGTSVTYTPTDFAVTGHNKQDSFSFVISDGTRESTGYVTVRMTYEYSIESLMKSWDLSTTSYLAEGLAIDGTGARVAAGAPNSNAACSDCGAVTVFERSGAGDSATYRETAFITAIDTWDGLFFGRAIALSPDGNTMFVGAPETATDLSTSVSYSPGQVYIYNYDTDVPGQWRLADELKIRDMPNVDDVARFGWSIAVSRTSGTTIAVGAPLMNNGDVADGGLVFTYEYDASLDKWGSRRHLQMPLEEPDTDSHFGDAVVLDNTGLKLAVTATKADVFGRADAGAAFVFSRSSTANAWTLQGILTAPNGNAADEFGWSIAMNGAGTLIAVGQPGGYTRRSETSGNAMLYHYFPTENDWEFAQVITAAASRNSDLFGYSLSISGDGTRLMVGAKNADSADTVRTTIGASYMFAVEAGSASSLPIARFSHTHLYESVLGGGTLSSSQLGWTTAMSVDGNYVAMGCPRDDTFATNSGGLVVAATDNLYAAVQDDYVFMYVSDSLTIDIDVLANDKDPESGALSLQSVGVVVVPTLGSVSISGGKARYTATDASSAHSLDVFSYTAKDSSGQQTTATVYLYHTNSFAVTDAVVGFADGSGPSLAGSSVVVSDDGNVLVFGAPEADTQYEVSSIAQTDAGVVHIFVRDPQGDNRWRQTQILHQPHSVTTSSRFGRTAVLSSDATVLLIGAESADFFGYANVGLVFVYSLDTASGIASYRDILHTEDINAPNFGFSLAIAKTVADVAVVGGYDAHVPRRDTTGYYSDAGALYVFKRESGTKYSWAQTALLTTDNGLSSDQLGWRVAISGDGTKIVGCASTSDFRGSASGACYVYRPVANSEEWYQAQFIAPSYLHTSTYFGRGLSMSLDGSVLAIGAENHDFQVAGLNVGNPGAVFTYVEDGDHYLLTDVVHEDEPVTNHYFGSSVCLSNDGRMMLVGVPSGTSAAYPARTTAGYGVVMVASDNQASKWHQSMRFDHQLDNNARAGLFCGLATSNGLLLALGAKNADDPIGNTGATVTMFRANLPPAAPFEIVKYYPDTETSINIEILANVFDFEGDTISISGVTSGTLGTVTHPAGQSHIVYTRNAAQAAGTQDTFTYNVTDNNADGVDNTVTRSVKIIFTDTFNADGANTLTYGYPVIAYDQVGRDVATNDDGSIVVAGADCADHCAGYIHIFERSGSTFRQVQRVSGRDGLEDDYFGYRVAIASSVDIIAAGAYAEDHGVGSGGAVYMFERDASTGEWVEKQKIVNPIQHATQLGSCVGISADGSIVLAGGKNQDDVSADVVGSAAFFKYDSSTKQWEHVNTFMPENAWGSTGQAGFSCGLDHSGLVAAVGAPFYDNVDISNEGAVYVVAFDESFNAYTLQATIFMPEADSQTSSEFGTNTVISGDGERIVASATHWNYFGTSDVGRVYVFKKQNNDVTQWTFEASIDRISPYVTPVASAFFGEGLGINTDGSVLLIGRSLPTGNQGSWVYMRDVSNSNAWALVRTLDVPVEASDRDQYGYSTAVSGDGSLWVTGAYAADDLGTNSGWVSVFRNSGATPPACTDDELIVYKTETQDADVLANDFDVAGNTPLTINSVSAATYGIATIETVDSKQVIRYVANGGVGDVIDDLTVTITNSVGVSSTSVLLVKVYDQMAHVLRPFQVTTSDHFGSCISADGERVLIGAYTPTTRNGYAVIMERVGGQWRETARLAGRQALEYLDPAQDDHFGSSCDLRGDTALVCAGYADVESDANRGQCYVFEYDSSTDTWPIAGVLDVFGPQASASDRMGEQVNKAAVTIDGTIAVTGAALYDHSGSSSGAAFVFKRNAQSGAWEDLQMLTAETPLASARFGDSVAACGVGPDTPTNVQQRTLIAVGASRESGNNGAFYVFQYDEDTANFTLVMSYASVEVDAYLGWSISLSADCRTLAVGAPYAHGVTLADEGSVLVFRDTAASSASQPNFELEQALFVSDATASDYMGKEVVLSDNGQYLLTQNQKSTSSSYMYMFVASSPESDTSKRTWGELSKTLTDETERDYFARQIGMRRSDAKYIFGGAMETDSPAAGGTVFAFTDSQPPLISDDSGETFEGLSIEIPVLANDVEPTGALLSIIAVGTPSNGGSVVISDDGKSVIFTASESGANTLDTFTYDATNGDGTGTGTVTVAVKGYFDYYPDYAVPYGLASSDLFGYYSAMSDDGQLVIVGTAVSDADGFASLFQYSDVGGKWFELAQFRGSDYGADSYYGSGIAISGDGTLVVVCGYGSTSNSLASAGLCHAFQTAGAIAAQEAAAGSSSSDDEESSDDSDEAASTVWQLTQTFVASDETANADFGASVHVSKDGTFIVIGAPGAGASADAGAAYAFRRVNNTWSEEQKFVASNAASGDRFGHSVQCDDFGTAVIVGAPNRLSLAGAVYVFTRSEAEVWTETTTFAAPDTVTNAKFGSAIACDADCAGVLIGSPGFSSSKGQVYSFSTNGAPASEASAWEYEVTLTPSDLSAQQFGFSLGLTADGLFAIIGGYLSAKNRAYTFRASLTSTGRQWAQAVMLSSATGVDIDYFGISASIAAENELVGAVGAAYSDTEDSNAGLVYFMNLTWPDFPLPDTANVYVNESVEVDVTGNDFNVAGVGVVLHTVEQGEYGSAQVTNDGTVLYTPTPSVASKIDTILYTAEYNGVNETGILTVNIYNLYDQIVESFDSPSYLRLGASVAASNDSSIVVVGGYGASSRQGRVSVYRRHTSSLWYESAQLTSLDSRTSTNDDFGFSVSMSYNSKYILVGARNAFNGRRRYAGALYVFTQVNNVWKQQAKLTVTSNPSSYDRLGHACAMDLDGSVAIGGAYGEDTGGGSSGAVYVFRRQNDDPKSWVEEQMLKQDFPTSSDNFGWSCDINGAGDVIVVGARRAYGTGAAYLFGYNTTSLLWEQITVLREVEMFRRNDYVGYDVSISSDGKHVIAGAPYADRYRGYASGGVYIWRDTSTNGGLEGDWEFESFVVGPESDYGSYRYLGWSVSMSADGNAWVAGERHRGTSYAHSAARVYSRVTSGDQTGWTMARKFQPSDGEDRDLYGWAVDISDDKGTVVVGCPYVDIRNEKNRWVRDAGVAYIYNMDSWPPAALPDVVKTFIDDVVVIPVLENDFSPFTSNSNSLNLRRFTTPAQFGVAEIQSSQISYTAPHTPSVSDVFEYEMGVTGSSSIRDSPDNIELSEIVDADTNAGTVVVNVYGKFEEKIESFSPQTYERFGSAVDMSADGMWACIGGDFTANTVDTSGQAFVVDFNTTDSLWRERERLSAGDNPAGIRDDFGASCSVNDDGTYIVVGAPQAVAADESTQIGAVYTFARNTTTGVWTKTGKITASDAIAFDRLGWSVSLANDASVLAIGASRADIGAESSAGSVYMYNMQAGAWQFDVKLTAPTPDGGEYFGYDVDLSANKLLLAVGAERTNLPSRSNAGAVYTYRSSASVWSHDALITATDLSASEYFGSSVSVARSGVVDVLAVGAPQAGYASLTNDAGAAYIFTSTNNGAWSQEAKIVPHDGANNNLFGLSVSLVGTGNVVLVGAPGQSSATNGQVYMFAIDPSASETAPQREWIQTSVLTASDGAPSDYFGTSVSISQSTGAFAALGAPGADLSYDGIRHGAVYIKDAPWPPAAITDNVRTYENETVTVAVLDNDFDWQGQPFSLVGVATAPSQGSVQVSGNSIVYTPNTGVVDLYDSFTYTIETDSNGVQANGTVNVYIGIAYEYEVFRATPEAGDNFGYAIDASANGTRVVASGHASNGLSVAAVFERSASDQKWRQVVALTAPNKFDDSSNEFGAAVAMRSDGREVVVCAPLAELDPVLAGKRYGKCYMYVQSALSKYEWEVSHVLSAADGTVSSRFGDSVHWSADESTIFIGATGSRKVYVFQPAVSGATTVTTITSSSSTSGDGFGASLDSSSDASVLAVGAPQGSVGLTSQAGTAYIFRDSSNALTWSASEYVLTSPMYTAESSFGSSVGISADGLVAAIGAPQNDQPGSANIVDAGKVWVFDYSSGSNSWVSTASLEPDHLLAHASQNFGTAVKVLGSPSGSSLRSIAVGAPGSTASVYASAGACYMFALYTGVGAGGADVWQEMAFITAADPATSDKFGSSLAASHDASQVFVGTPFGDDKASQGGSFYHIVDASSTPAAPGFDYRRIGENQVITFNMLDNDYDLDGDTLTVLSITAASVGTAVLQSNQASVEYTPPVDTVDVSATFSYVVSDGTHTTTGQVQIDVIGKYTDGRIYAFDRQSNEALGSVMVSDGDGILIAAAATARNDVTSNVGVVELFERDTGDDSWTVAGRITSPTGSTGGSFGTSLAMNSDASVLVVGASLQDDSVTDGGACFVYKYTGGLSSTTNYAGPYDLVARLLSSDMQSSDQFCDSVTLSENGDSIIVGAPNDNSDTGAVYVFSTSDNGETWSQIQRLVASDRTVGDMFGAAVAVSDDGNTLAVGAPKNNGRGTMYVFNRTSSTVAFETAYVHRFIPSDVLVTDFGSVLDIATDGSVIAVGAPSATTNTLATAGQVLTYRYVSAAVGYEYEQSLTASDPVLDDRFGSSVSMTSLANLMIIGSPGNDGEGSTADSGAAYTFKFDSTAWTEVTKQTSLPAATAGDGVGASVATTSGSLYLAGASSAGNSYVAVLALITNAPDCNPDSAATDQVTTIIIDVLANDGNITDVNNVTLEISRDPQYGSATVLANQTIMYVPNPEILSSFELQDNVVNCAGSDSFVYRVTNLEGGADAATVDVNVTDLSDPVAVCSSSHVINLDSEGKGSISVADADGGSYDDCGLASKSIDKTQVNCSHTGGFTVTLTVEDTGGKQDSCTTTLAVNDAAGVCSCSYDEEPQPPLPVADAGVGTGDLSPFYLINLTYASGYDLGVKVEFANSDPGEYCDFNSLWLNNSIWLEEGTNNNCFGGYQMQAPMSNMLSKCGFEQNDDIEPGRTCFTNIVTVSASWTAVNDLRQTYPATRSTQFAVQLCIVNNATATVEGLQVYGNAFQLDLLGSMTIDATDSDNDGVFDYTVSGRLVTSVQWPYRLELEQYALDNDFWSNTSSVVPDTYCSANSQFAECIQVWQFQMQVDPAIACISKNELTLDELNLTMSLNCSESYEGECSPSFAVEPRIDLTLSSPDFCPFTRSLDISAEMELYQYELLTVDAPAGAFYDNSVDGIPALFGPESAYTVDSTTYGHIDTTVDAQAATLASTVITAIRTVPLGRSAITVYDADRVSPGPGIDSSVRVENSGFGTGTYSDSRARFQFTWSDATLDFPDKDGALTVSVEVDLDVTFVEAAALPTDDDTVSPVLSSMVSEHFGKERRETVLFAADNESRLGVRAIAQVSPGASSPGDSSGNSSDSSFFGATSAADIALGAGALVALVALVVLAVTVYRRNSGPAKLSSYSSNPDINALPYMGEGIELQSTVAPAIIGGHIMSTNGVTFNNLPGVYNGEQPSIE